MEKSLLKFIETYLPKHEWDKSREHFGFRMRQNLSASEMLDWCRYVFPKALKRYNELHGIGKQG